MLGAEIYGCCFCIFHPHLAFSFSCALSDPHLAPFPAPLPSLLQQARRLQHGDRPHHGRRSRPDDARRRGRAQSSPEDAKDAENSSSSPCPRPRCPPCCSRHRGAQRACRGREEETKEGTRIVERRSRVSTVSLVGPGFIFFPPRCMGDGFNIVMARFSDPCARGSSFCWGSSTTRASELIGHVLLCMSLPPPTRFDMGTSEGNENLLLSTEPSEQGCGLEEGMGQFGCIAAIQ